MGRDPPAKFYDKPEIPEHLHLHHAAFLELSTERQIGFGLGPIPRSAMTRYVNDLGLSLDGAETFSAILSRLDSEYLAMINSGAKADPKELAMVPISNVGEMRRLFKSLHIRQKNVMAKKKIRAP